MIKGFSYKVNAEGYMIYYDQKPLGGAGIIGMYRGWSRIKQIQSYVEQAKRIVEELRAGRGPQHMREAMGE